VDFSKPIDGSPKGDNDDNANGDANGDANDADCSESSIHRS